MTFITVSDCRQSYFIKQKGSGNEWVSRMESAVGIHFRRGKQQVSRLLSRWNLSVYSSVWTSRNPDFDLGVDFVDTLKPWLLSRFLVKYKFIVALDHYVIATLCCIHFQERISKLRRFPWKGSCHAVTEGLPSPRWRRCHVSDWWGKDKNSY